jgi:hypothetical protein
MTVLKLRVEAGQSGAVNKTSAESTAQDDNFKGVKRCKRHISNDISQTAKSAKPVTSFAAVKLPAKAVLTCDFSSPLRSTDMATETTDAENTLLE